MAASSPPGFTRRDFLTTGAKLGAAFLAAPYILRSAPESGGDTVNVALIGCGEQGRVLLNATLKIPDIRFKAVCDIWPYNRRYGERLLQKFGHDPKPFEDYREMLSAVPDVDAVIVATPDFMHSEHTCAALKAGHHVYCEKLMSNTVEGARAMVRASHETGKLLQIGHQRRSNPRYLWARDKLIRDAHLLGRITNASAQWNRAVTEDLGFPLHQELSEAVLHKYGYEDMHQFRNWRWFKKYSGGVISDLGAHQIDVFNWMLGVNPVSVLAGGGRDYYTTHEWYDNVIAIYEYPTEAQIVRTTYTVLTTTSAGGGYHEYFMGDEGALKMSENPKYTKLYREARAPDWQPWVDKGYIARPGSGEGALTAPRPWDKPRPQMPRPGKGAGTVDVRETAELSAWDIPVTLDKAIHQPHLENFFDSIRGRAKLNCPGESALATAATVLRVNAAVAARQMLTFAPGDFTI
ncbi:MAG TPA: Gfo/Idh/MocA family oxidoreductase [Candidatus Didemnitutus sp.]|nr:Gfo/Idh/MocA family oxidoreductase [Candidatus Didemnitutus sp.]